jgi:nucleotide-binding universal stress UspA family protein
LKSILPLKEETAIAYVEKLGKEAGVKVEPVFLKGIPAEKILEYAEESNIDLVVMGTQGLTDVKRFLIGSMAENVLRHSKVPVMIIR